MKINAIAVEVLLAKKGLTKTEMAAKATLTKQAVSTILSRGTCEPKTLGKIAAALEVDASELVAKEG